MKNRAEDSLENFIKKNKEELNALEPPKGLWDKIAEELDEEEESVSGHSPPKVIQIRHSTLWRIAATISLIAGMYIVFQLNPFKNTANSKSLAVYEQEIELEEINPELAEAETYYTTLISQKRQEIAAFPLDAPGVDADFKKDIEELDKMYTNLKEELYETPGQERVVDAMIMNLQMRIRILNQQLEILKKIQKLKNKHNNEEHSI